MADFFERFFNWLTDKDWWWGPFLFLRPPQNVRLTLRLWLKLFGLTLLFVAPIEASLAVFWFYYDHAAMQHHEAKIPPVAATEALFSRTSPVEVLQTLGGVLAVSFLALIGTHWAWNRRADCLRRETDSPLPLPDIAPGVWPPPPSVP